MENLQDAMFNICRLKGELLGTQAMINAILNALSDEQLVSVLHDFRAEMELARAHWLNSSQAGEGVSVGLETYAQQVSANYPGKQF
jgi:hypothetical protein